MLNAVATTWSGRYRRNGYFWQGLRNILLVILFFAGVAPEGHMIVAQRFIAGSNTAQSNASATRAADGGAGGGGGIWGRPLPTNELVGYYQSSLQD